MADQKNRGGQKRGKQQPAQPEQKQGTSQAGGERSDVDRRQDQINNPDDERRQATNEQR